MLTVILLSTLVVLVFYAIGRHLNEDDDDFLGY